MATLTVADMASTDAALKPRGSATLRDWMAGQWAVLFSHPEHFAPHPTTPAGFITLLADDFAMCGVKPIKLAGSGDIEPSWLDFAGTDSATVMLNNTDFDSVVDLSEHALAMTIARLDTPFVLIIDANARCRSTISSRQRAGEPSRSVADVLQMVQVLQTGRRCAPLERYGRMAAG